MEIYFGVEENTCSSCSSSNSPFSFKFVVHKRIYLLFQSKNPSVLFLPNYSCGKLSQNKQELKNFHARKQCVPLFSLLRATLFFCSSSSFSQRSHYDISNVASFSLLMDWTQKRNLLGSAGWNAKIIATVADVIVMDLNLSTQDIFRYIIHPTQKVVRLKCCAPQNCLDCCWRPKLRRNFFPETFWRGII